MATALRRHRRPNVVLANPDRVCTGGRRVASRAALGLVAAFTAAVGLVAAGCGGGSSKAEPPKLVSKSFTSVADSYVRSTQPHGNFGKNTELRIDATPEVRTYIRFMPFGISGRIERATLRVYALSMSTDGFQVRSVSGPWSESRLTFANAPAVGRVIDLSGVLSKDRWHSVDVTSLVRSRGSRFGLALVALGPTEIAVASRETPGQAPRLIIETRRPAGTS